MESNLPHIKIPTETLSAGDYIQSRVVQEVVNQSHWMASTLLKIHKDDIPNINVTYNTQNHDSNFKQNMRFLCYKHIQLICLNMVNIAS